MVMVIVLIWKQKGKGQRYGRSSISTRTPPPPQGHLSRIKKTYAEDGVIVLSDEELKHLWSHYEDNKNNLLDLHELHLLVADLVEHTIEDPAERDTVKSKINENGDFVDALFKQLDLNGDGVVEFHEFTKAYHKVLEHYLANH